MPLDLATAEKVAKAAMAKAREMGLTMSIGIVDEAGNTVYLARMDGAPFLSPQIALGKAFVSSAWKVSSAEIEKRAQTAPAFYASVATMSGGRAIVRQGALPIVVDGKVVGAAGASGGTSAEDEEVIRAGLTAL